MSQEYADQTAADCRRRAERMLHLANFVATRCARFYCLCVHDDGRIHVYDEADALAEFGTDGWSFLWTTDLGIDYIQKTVEGITVTFQRRTPHAFPPSLPPL